MTKLGVMRPLRRPFASFPAKLSVFAQHTEPLCLMEVNQFEVFQASSGHPSVATVSQGGQPWAFLSKKRHWLVGTGTPYADFSHHAKSDTFYLQCFTPFLFAVIFKLCFFLMGNGTTDNVADFADFERKSNSMRKNERLNLGVKDRSYTN